VAKFVHFIRWKSLLFSPTFNHTPKSGEVDKALTALAVYDIGKPIVIEEMFPLSCSVDELDQFIDGSRSRKLACGWIGFYWGKTIAEYKADQGSIADAFALRWLDYFAKKTPEILTHSRSYER
jgi:hypothetical protein